MRRFPETVDPETGAATRAFVVRAGLAAVWTLFVWGGRITLLTDTEVATVTTWIRVGGSLAFGLALAAAANSAWRGRDAGRGTAWLALAFAAWMAFIWLPDVVDVFRDDRSIGFVVVHVILAGVSLALGAVMGSWAVRKLSDEYARARLSD